MFNWFYSVTNLYVCFSLFNISFWDLIVFEDRKYLSHFTLTKATFRDNSWS